MAKILKSTLPYKPPKTENLIEFLRDGLRSNHNRTLFIGATSKRRWTGKEIEDVITRIAKFLIDHYEIKKGDVCSIYLQEDDLAVVLILALISVGATYHYLSDRASGWDVYNTAKVLTTKYLFSSYKLLETIHSKDILADLEDKLFFISTDEPFLGYKNGCKSILSYLSRTFPSEQLSCSLDDLVNRVSVNPEVDVSVIQFSSGTTGKPKPIPRTHKNLVHSVASVDHEELMDLKPGVVLTGIVPITHRPGLWALLATVHKGNTFVIWNELGGVEDALDTIEKFKVTIFSSSLPFLARLGNTGIKCKNKYDTSSLQHIITAGAKIVNPELPRLVLEEFKLKSLRQCFGMTESGWCFLIEQSLAKDNYLTVGHVVLGMEAVVINRDTKQLLGTNERGEIALRGPQIFPGYLTDKPDVLNRKDFDEAGWFLIGDEGYFDKNELIFIEGRYKEKMMLSNDYKFFPTEIETVINQHPAVEASCVVKLPNEVKDYEYDIARAYVTLKHGFNVESKVIIDFVEERAPEVYLEGGVRILSEFPRLQNGKVDKQNLAKMK